MAAAPLADLPGRFYQHCLHDIHQSLAPRTYLEIGVANGDSLALATCRSIAVDPSFRLKPAGMGKKPELHLFQMESDAFFATYDPIEIFRARIDVAFIDGMHLFEFVLRDFINTERVCHPGSLILLHDTAPRDPFMATRNPYNHATMRQSKHPGWWTGDVWKIVPVLKHYRPDLKVTTFDAPPTGLTLVTGLDADNRTLSEQYDAIVSPELGCLWHDDGLGDYLARIALTPTAHMPHYFPGGALARFPPDESTRPAYCNPWHDGAARW